MNQNRVLDLIIFLIDGVKNNSSIQSDYNKEILSINNCKYLLGQTLRQYGVSEGHCFVSEGANELWSKIRTDSIFNYTYRNKIVKNNDVVVFIDKYKGSERKPYQENVKLCMDDSFIFNDVFTDEHVVPINIIIKELVSLPICDYISVKKVLDKIYICKMLKKEDYKIAKRSNRSIDFKEVVNRDYLDAGIKLMGFNYEKLLEKKACSLVSECEKTNHTNKERQKVSKHIKKRKLQYNEYFIITNERNNYRNKAGFKAYNNSNEEIGIVFMCDDERTPAFQHCELCVYEDYRKEYGEWHRIKTHGSRIKWEYLCKILSEQERYRLFID